MAEAGNEPRDRQAFGVFKEETSHRVGDPYVENYSVPARFKGKQMGIEVPKEGRLNDAYFDKNFKRTTEGDRFLEPYLVDRLLTKTLNKDAPKLEKPFMPSAPAEKSAYPGSMYGTISRPLIDTDPSVRATVRHSAKDPADVTGKRKIYANPAKKATYGFPWHDRSIGGTTFEHMTDEYNPGARIGRELKAAARTRISKAFNSTGATGSNMPPPSGFLGGETIKQTTTKQATPHTHQWKPTNPPQKGKGNFGCLNKLEYVPEMTRPKEKHETAKGWVPPVHQYKRLSMRTINHYAVEPQPPKDDGFTLLA